MGFSLWNLFKVRCATPNRESSKPITYLLHKLFIAYNTSFDSIVVNFIRLILRLDFS